MRNKYLIIYDDWYLIAVLFFDGKRFTDAKNGKSYNGLSSAFSSKLIT